MLMGRHQKLTMKPRQRGFTLMELMIVVVIVAILVGVGYPSYRGTVLKTKRSVATAALSDFASRQESYYLDRKKYASSPVSLGYPAANFYINSDGTPFSSQQSDSVYFISLTVPNAAARTYTVTATPVGGQADDAECATITLNQNGQKSATGTATEKCW